MMIDKIKNYIFDNIGNTVRFKFNTGRNQITSFDAEILEAYRSIFIVKLLDNNIIKSFSYTDILIGLLVLE